MSHTGRILSPYIAAPTIPPWIVSKTTSWRCTRCRTNLRRGGIISSSFSPPCSTPGTWIQRRVPPDRGAIDGSFQHGGTTYLLEAKWHRAKTDAEKLHAFQGKLSERLEGTRGLFVSFEGFTHGALEAFTARRIILADGMDIFDALKRRISVPDIITAKARHSSECPIPPGA
jgi:hypothetical protein